MPSAANQEEVLRIKKKLDKINDRLKDDGHADLDRAMDLLRRLDNMRMTLDILTKTGVGMTVNSLRKSTDDDQLVSLTKALIKTWKKLVPGESSGSSSSSGSSGSRSSHGSSKKDAKKHETSSSSNTFDEVRLSCRKLLTGSLKGSAVVVAFYV